MYLGFLYSLNNDLDKLFIYVNYTFDSKTVNPNSTVSFAPVNNPVPAGYVPFSIVYFTVYNSHLTVRSVNCETGSITCVNLNNETYTEVTVALIITCIKKFYQK